MALQNDMQERSIHPCNFRTSGLLSNDSTRQLRSMHETFARAFSHALDLFLGSPLEVKLLKVEQQGSREFGSSMSPGSYLVPLALQPMGERAVARFDNALFFPLLDLLLGGTGDNPEETRELTEIDEELFRSVTELMCVQLERVWKSLELSVTPQPAVKTLLAGQLFLLEERVVTLHFEMRLIHTTALFEVALPGQMAGALIRGGQPDPAQIGLQPGAQQRLRKRLLNCTMPLSATLPDLQVPIGDLLNLEVGSLLNLRAPVQAPIFLQVGEYALFDVTPVRQGVHKAAQIIALQKHED
ncbi:MAG: FliM/FliN family flagellar motor switch protein [Janthinobacterium lividum]